MYTILVTDQNELITSVEEKIIQSNNLVDSLHFLVNPTYKDEDMSSYTCTMSYTTPVTKVEKTETLVLSSSLYENLLEYKLDIESAITAEAGRVLINLSFTDGDKIRKTGSAFLNIYPQVSWGDYVHEDEISVIEERLAALLAEAAALETQVTTLSATKADDITLTDDGDLQLTANGETVGNAVSVTTPGASDTFDGTQDGLIDLTTST